MAVALPGREEPVYRGEIKNQRKSLVRLIRSLSPHGEVLSFCYATRPVRAGTGCIASRYNYSYGQRSARLKVIASERADAHRIVVLRRRDQHPLPVAELERLEGAVGRLDEPQVRDAFARVEGPLLVQVDLARGC